MAQILSSEYQAIFDSSSREFSIADKIYNMAFLKTIQGYARDMIQTKGFLFLNQARDLLGLPYIPQGQLLGWLKTSEQDESKIFSFEWDTEAKYFVITFHVQGDIHEEI